MEAATEQKRIDVEFIPGPVTSKFLLDKDSRVKLLIGPFGTGKTSAAAMDLVFGMTQRIRPLNGLRSARYAVVRNTYPELRDTTIHSYRTWFNEKEWDGSYNVTDKKLSLHYLMDEVMHEVDIIFKALESDEDVRDLLSLELTGGHVDESREVRHDIIKGLLGRIGRWPPKNRYRRNPRGEKEPYLSPPQLLLTTNYPSRDHWIYKDFVGEPIQGYTMYECGQDENIHNLREGYYDDLEKDYADRPDLLRTLVRGQWGITVVGKRIYPGFRRDLHVAPKPLKPVRGANVIRCWDNTGLSPACAATQISPTGQWLVQREFCGDDIGITDFADVVKIWGREYYGDSVKYTDYGDPAGKNRDSSQQSPKDYLRKKGIMVLDGIQNLKIRIDTMTQRFSRLINGQPAILIDPACTKLIDGCEGGYAYKEYRNTGIFLEEPEKNEYAHIQEALQYGATRLFRSEEKRERLQVRTLGVA